MPKIKYYYDTKSLSYKPIESTGVDKFKSFIVYFTSSGILAFFILLIFFQFFDSPKEKRLKNEINNLTSQYEIINNNLPEEKKVTYSAPGVYNIVTNRFIKISENKTKFINEQEFEFKGYMKVMGFFMPSAFK